MVIICFCHNFKVILIDSTWFRVRLRPIQNEPQKKQFPFIIDFEFISNSRLLDVCHGQLERERQLVLFLVFEHLEEDLAGYLSRVGPSGMSPRIIQVRY